MATAKQIEIPLMTEVTVSYSAGVKCNLGHNTFESADFHISRTEKYDVSGLDDVAIELFWDERYDILKEEIDAKIIDIHEDTSGILPERDD